MQSRAEGALLGTMLGDALGRPFEGTPLTSRPRLVTAVQRRVIAPRAWGYSDDAEMMLAVGDSIARLGAVDEAHIMETMASSHEVARGYGKGTRAAFRVWRETGSWALSSRALWPEGSRGNGAAVRMAPVAVLHRESSMATLRAAARRSAVPTHAHEEALAGAELVALGVWVALQGVTPTELLEVLRLAAGGTAFNAPLRKLQVVHSPEEAIAGLGHDVFAIESVPLAIWAHCRHRSFEDAVMEAVSAGGDTDSIGAMTGALAGATYGVEAIPKAWAGALETHGRRRVQGLVRALMAR
ncbi:MAG: ADP-ribosylglycohydrolase family protein [Polyangiales bacterium]